MERYKLIGFVFTTNLFTVCMERYFIGFVFTSSDLLLLCTVFTSSDLFLLCTVFTSSDLFFFVLSARFAKKRKRKLVYEC